MKAAQYRQYGGPEVIEIVEIEKPAPKAGQIIVEVKAASVNVFDWKVRRGYMKDAIPITLPITIGADFAGIVTEVPGGITEFSEGDDVYGSVNVLNGGSGAFAEFATANIDSIALKPTTIDYEQSAAIVLVGVSSMQALDQLELREGKKVLIHGGAGGIGSSAIQYAKHLGAEVMTTARAADKDFVTSLGADTVVDYESEDFSGVLSDMDTVFDTVGGETYTKSFKVLKKGGKIVSMNEQPNNELAAEYGVTAILLSAKVNAESLNRLKEVVDKGVIKPQIDKVFMLNQAAEAFDYQENGHSKGKVVVKVK